MTAFSRAIGWSFTSDWLKPPSPESMMRSSSLMIGSLVVALVLLGLPIVTATAQAPRRSSQPMQDAIRAIHEGRFDEVALITEKLDAQDPDVVAVRARALIARGRYGDAESLLRPIVSRAGTSEAALELGLLQQMLGKPTPVRFSSAWRPGGFNADPVASPEALMRSARSAVAATPTTRTGWPSRAERPRHQYRMGRAVSRNVQHKSEALKSFNTVLQVDSRWTPALMGGRARWPTTTRRRLSRRPRRSSRSTRRRSMRGLSGATGGRLGSLSRGATALQKALTVNPSSIEVHAQLAAIASSRTSNRSSRPRSARRWRSRPVAARCSAPQGSAPPAATGLTKPWR